ncbi:hypothetical protein [Streptomyces sp. NPDC014734]|uniref:hypothetical protein n=1 Tax=Streptomyces sp. NPDC014734 TaxID=3364886 RepID=UPI0036FF9024
MSCPRCRGTLSATRPGGTYGCAVCRYEITAEAWHLHQPLLTELAADEGAFFARIEERTTRIRAHEPAWR